ncbi:DUF6879 family protein [Streptomyces roseoverticillatus]|uniref:DUF6879 family protein n=1 Tax=Streptomyces roseoverticillatus TaxID=66429 RepID=UPI0033E36893
MSRNSVPDVTEPLRCARRSAVHRETRDLYGTGDEAGVTEPCTRTGGNTPDPSVSSRPGRPRTVGESPSRGVVTRRARIVSEPVTDYIRWEHAVTAPNLDAGEQARWLPGRRTSDIALPGNDFRLLAARLTVLPFSTFSASFTGDGGRADPAFEITGGPAAVRLCTSACEAVRERGVSHETYSV